MMKLYESRAQETVANLVRWKNEISQSNAVLLPHDWKDHRQCISDKGMAMALDKEVWIGSKINS